MFGIELFWSYGLDESQGPLFIPPLIRCCTRCPDGTAIGVLPPPPPHVAISHRLPRAHGRISALPDDMILLVLVRLQNVRAIV